MYKCEKYPFTSHHRGIINQHIKGVHEKLKNHFCEDCEFAAKTKRILQSHWISVHNRVGKKFKCEQCSYSTVRKSNLKTHVEQIHDKIMRHSCEKCGEVFLRKLALGRHLELVHGIGDKKFKCEKCPYSSFLKKNVYIHIRGVHEKIRNHVCEDCSFATSVKANLKRHRESVHEMGEEKFKCDLCPYETQKKANLRRHVKSNHIIKV